MNRTRYFLAAGVLGATTVACLFPSLSSLEDAREGEPPSSDAAAPVVDGALEDAAPAFVDASPPDAGASDSGPTILFADSWDDTDASTWSGDWLFRGNTTYFKTPSIEDNSGRVEPKAALDGGGLAVFYAFPRHTVVIAKNVVQRIRVRSSSTSHRFGVFARVKGQNLNGGGPNTTAYLLDCVPTGCEIGRLVDSSYKILAAIPSDGLSSDDLEILFSVVDGEGGKALISAKVWPSILTEPTVPTMVTDDDPALRSAGFVGIRFRSSVDNGTFNVDDYVVRTP